MITFGEKEAFDAYRDFCMLQQKLIGDLLATIETISKPRPSFSSPTQQKPKTLYEEELDIIKGSSTEQEMKDLLAEAGFLTSDLDEG